jgi:hypothetical protein
VPTICATSGVVITCVKSGWGETEDVPLLFINKTRVWNAEKKYCVY